MREIKFRYTFKHTGTGNVEKKIYTLKQLEERNVSELSPCFNKEFGYELVSRDQYTGLKDAKGNEIYTGDMILVFEWNRKYKVVFERGMFKVSGSTTFSLVTVTNGELSCEVIGNIYEN